MSWLPKDATKELRKYESPYLIYYPSGRIKIRTRSKGCVLQTIAGRCQQGHRVLSTLSFRAGGRKRYLQISIKVAVSRGK